VKTYSKPHLARLGLKPHETYKTYVAEHTTHTAEHSSRCTSKIVASNRSAMSLFANLDDTKEE
jgi:hypothetical protein